MEMVHFIPPLQRRIALSAAQADAAPVLIYGGSGTGKGAIARWIHDHGPRVSKPLITADKKLSLASQIPVAQGGTLVVPEIGEWPLGEQKTLLTYLSTRSIPHPENPQLRVLINTRIIATTDQALERRAEAGLFNGELLAKLNAHRLEMPPLAKRTEEFPDIVTGIIGEISRELHKEHLKGLDPQVWDRLRAYEWPGNLRELRNVLRVAVISTQTDHITEADLPEFGNTRVDFKSTREDFERLYILELLRTFDGQVDKACESTRIDKTTLLSKIKKYGITVKGDAP